jgi:hypothetical protein
MKKKIKAYAKKNIKSRTIAYIFFYFLFVSPIDDIIREIIILCGEGMTPREKVAVGLRTNAVPLVLCVALVVTFGGESEYIKFGPNDGLQILGTKINP